VAKPVQTKCNFFIFFYRFAVKWAGNNLSLIDEKLVLTEFGSMLAANARF
jgi:hypothetical protein